MKTVLFVGAEPIDAESDLDIDIFWHEKRYRLCYSDASSLAANLAKHGYPDLFLIYYRLKGTNGIQLYDSVVAHTCARMLPAIMICTSVPGAWIAPALRRRRIMGLYTSVQLYDLFLYIDRLCS